MIRANVESHVARVLVIEGQHVKKGELLVELSCEIASAKNEVARLAAEERGPELIAKAELEFARRHFEQIASLYKKKAINENEFNEAELRFNIAKAKFRVATEQKHSNQARYSLSKAELSDYFLRAPFDGQVSRLKVGPGSIVSSHTDMLELMATDILKMDLYVSLDSSSSYSVGSLVRLRIHEPFRQIVEAKVVYRSPKIEATTGSLRIGLEFENQELKLPSGITVSLAE